jgi:non-ribosomal peptide synthetase component E (peptide arylation enzyme)
MWVVLGGIPIQGRYCVPQINSSLFNIDGFYTLSLLIKKEGLVTPLATIYFKN